MRICGGNCKEQSGNCYELGADSVPVQCVGSWVEDKYSFLERYIDATRSARKKYTDKGNSVYIDLFSGPGRCIIKRKQKEIDGGALRVYKYRKVPFNEYVYIDIHEPNVRALEKRINEPNCCTFICNDANVYIQTLVESLRRKNYRYHFAFIDPFGPEDLKFTSLKLLAELPRIDFLIHFPIGAIKRNISKWKENDYGVLDDFLGTGEWRDKVPDFKKGKTLTLLLEIYKRQLMKIGFPEDGLKTKDSHENLWASLPAVSVRNTKAVELYVLILASKHPIAQIIWSHLLNIDADGQRTIKWD
jgi:three-Cys-motif partner protein